jgi:hypothetical protein
MGQLVPSVLFHAQAIKLITELRDAYGSKVATVDDLVQQLRDAVTNFEATVGMPFFDFEPVVEGEPPLATKINRLWDNLMHDINILEQQADISRASTIFTHNLVATEVLKAQQANARVANKLKTLQLYSKSVDSSIIVFGDHFRSTDFMDFTLMPEGERPNIRGEGYVVLGQDGPLWDLANMAGLRILDTSNGFLGNLHEIDTKTDPREVTFTRNATGTYNTETDASGTTVHKLSSDGLVTDMEPVFKAETHVRRDLGTVTDGGPDTWIEYEYCKISDADRNVAKNLNFTYARRTVTEAGEEKVEYIDWASGPPNGVLKLGIEFDLLSVQNVNYIHYLPFNLDENDNYPVTVTQVQTSVDRTNWEPVRPRDLVIGNTSNLQSGNGTVVGDGIWAFSGRQMRYVQMHIEQSKPVTRKMGHLYYEVEKRVGERQVGLYTVGVYDIERAEGPAPNINDPTFYYDPSIRRVKKSAEDATSMIQRRETFIGQRWAIGIRDIRIQQVNHLPTSTIVTKRLRVGGVVDRVLLDADITIPPEYGDGQGWISFFISPDDGARWFPIGRVQDDYLGIPEVVSFNDPLPEAMREPGVGYYSTPNPVTTLRLKIVLTRPPNLPSTTPVLRNYELKVKKRVA